MNAPPPHPVVKMLMRTNFACEPCFPASHCTYRLALDTYAASGAQPVGFSASHAVASLHPATVHKADAQGAAHWQTPGPPPCTSCYPPAT